MTAEIVPINGTPPTPAPLAPAELDVLLAGNATDPLKPVTDLVVVTGAHPLEGIDTVEGAAAVIGQMLVEDREAKGVRVYPRRLLRQQHIAAYMLVNPFATTTEICRFFGIGAGALSNICKSDTFKALVESHKVSVETSIGADLTEQLRQTLAVAIDVTQKAVITGQDPEFALQVLDKTANRLGLGAKHNTNVQINNNIVTPEMIAQARARRLADGR